MISYFIFATNVYFTRFPQHLYHYSNSVGNMAYAGIAEGLIHSQHMFWLANLGVLIKMSNTNHTFQTAALTIAGLLYMGSIIRFQQQWYYLKRLA
jgi:hypothetical protein